MCFFRCNCFINPHNLSYLVFVLLQTKSRLFKAGLAVKTELSVLKLLYPIKVSVITIGMDDSSYRLNFDLGKKNEIHHYS